MSRARGPRPVVWLVVVTGLLAVLSAGAVAMLAFRIDRVGRLSFLFLVKNLVLAWIPFLLSVVLAGLRRIGAPRVLLVLVGGAWLVFLPNAPYILTDFVHLAPSPDSPLWFDAGLIGAFAAVGLALGLVSLLVVHRIVEARAGRVLGWVVALASLVLSTVGIYLGRFPRFNSWDVLANPESLVSLVLYRLADPLGNPFLLRFLAAMSVLLLGSYAVSWLLGRHVLGPAGRPDRGARPAG